MVDFRARAYQSHPIRFVSPEACRNYDYRWDGLDVLLVLCPQRHAETMIIVETVVIFCWVRIPRGMQKL